MVDRSEYVWGSHDDEREFERLRIVSTYFDPQTRFHLEGLISSGARCLEVGPGTGSISKWLVEQCCSVVALDISDRFFPGTTHQGSNCA